MQKKKRKTIKSWKNIVKKNKEVSIILVNHNKKKREENIEQEKEKKGKL